MSELKKSLEIKKFIDFINILSNNIFFKNIFDNNIYLDDSIYLINDVLKNEDLLNKIDDDNINYTIILSLNNSNNIINDLNDIDNFLNHNDDLKNFKIPKFIILPNNNFDDYEFKYFDNLIFYDMQNYLNNNISNKKFDILNQLYDELIILYNNYNKELMNKYKFNDDINKIFNLIKPIINIDYLIKSNDEMIKQVEKSIFIIKFNLSLEFILNSLQNIINNNKVLFLNCKCINIIHNQNNLLQLTLTFNNLTSINKNLFISNLKFFINNNYSLLNKFNFDIYMVNNGIVF